MRLWSLVGYETGYEDALKECGTPLWALIFDVEPDYMTEDFALLTSLGA